MQLNTQTLHRCLSQTKFADKHLILCYLKLLICRLMPLKQIRFVAEVDA